MACACQCWVSILQITSILATCTPTLRIDNFASSLLLTAGISRAALTSSSEGLPLPTAKGTNNQLLFMMGFLSEIKSNRPTALRRIEQTLTAEDAEDFAEAAEKIQSSAFLCAKAAALSAVSPKQSSPRKLVLIPAIADGASFSPFGPT